MRLPAAVGLAFFVVAGGCLDSADVQGAAHPEASPDGSGPSSPDAPPGKARAPSARPPPAAPPIEQPPWPKLDEATVRPGVQAVADGAQCTTNFLFQSADNSTLYLGLASHCVDGLKLGDPVRVDGALKPARLAYSAWIAIGLECDADTLGTTCTDGDFENDFALIALDPADRPRIHPAVLHFGGPTHLADSRALRSQDRVLNYGNSGTWSGADPLQHHEGVVSEPQGGGLQFRILTAAPGVKGDSGSPVLTRAGAAAGVLVTSCISPCPGQSGIVGLKAQLDLAATHGVHAGLATWGLIDDGLLP